MFQSTRPSRGATSSVQPKRQSASVSIHAPLAGRDLLFVALEENGIKFQSTRPSRGATAIGKSIGSALMFQSTRPSRGATRIQA